MNKPLHQPARTRTTLSLVAAAVALAAPAVSSALAVEKSVKVAAGVYQIGVDPASQTVYVASVGGRGENAAQLVAFDADTLERKGSIALEAPIYGLGINAKTQTLYGTDTRAGNITVVDLKTGKVTATIGEGDGAHLREVRIDEAANRVYVSVVGTREAASEFWIIDGATNELLRKVPVETDTVTGIALDPAGNRIFATGQGANEIAVVDLASGATVAKWPAGGESPTNAEYDAATQRLFVANQGGTLTVIDAKDGSLIKSIPTGEGSLDVKLDSDNPRVYVSNRGAGTLSVVDTETYEVVAHLPTGTLPQTIAVDDAGGRVFVSNKARGLGRNAPRDAVPPDDPNGDTLTLVRQ